MIPFRISHRHASSLFSPSTRTEKLLSHRHGLMQELNPWLEGKICLWQRQEAGMWSEAEWGMFYYCFWCQGWLCICLGFVNDSKRHLKKSYSSGSSDMQLLLQVLTFTRDRLIHILILLTSTLSSLGLFRPNQVLCVCMLAGVRVHACFPAHRGMPQNRGPSQNEQIYNFLGLTVEKEKLVAYFLMWTV